MFLSVSQEGERIYDLHSTLDDVGSNVKVKQSLLALPIHCSCHSWWTSLRMICCSFTKFMRAEQVSNASIDPRMLLVDPGPDPDSSCQPCLLLLLAPDQS